MRNDELICRLVIAHELKPNDPLLRDEYFQIGCAEEWRFLKKFYAEFGLLPNAETFKTQFPEFAFIETTLTAQWLADDVAQDFLDFKMRDELTRIDAKRAENPRESVALLQQIGRDLLPYLSNGLQSSDVFDQTVASAEVLRRCENKNLAGITLGFDLLDEVTKGTQQGEIEVYFARPGIGKSLILWYGAIQASNSGKRVSFVSPEMNRFEMDVRYQSFRLHVSALALISGEMDSEDRNEYMRTLLKLDDMPHGPAFRFYEPIGMGRKFTTEDVLRIIKHDDPHLVCIDGIMLIEPMQYDKDVRKRIINTMEELKRIVVETGVPIRLAHQANRESEGRVSKKSSASLTERIPGLHHMAESGSVEQYANRAIALQRLNDRFYMAVRKNRSGPSGRIIQMEHDIDRGKFREIVVVNGEDSASSAESIKGTKRF